MYDPEFWKRRAYHLPSSATERFVVSDNYLAVVTAQDNPKLNAVKYIHGDFGTIFSQLDDLYSDKNQGYGVEIRPTDPPDLTEFVRNRGYIHNNSFELRVLELTPEIVDQLQANFDTTDFMFKALSDEEMLAWDIFDMINHAFFNQQGTFTDYQKAKQQSMAAFEGLNYKALNLVCFDGDKPVAFSELYYNMSFENYQYGFLSGAATLEEYRHRGIYSAMIYHRAQAALDSGLDFIVIQATSSTSAPIVAKYGFTLVEPVDLYLPSS